MTEVKYYAFRLAPGQDLKTEIQAFVVENNIFAGWVCTCIGSLTNYAIRFANQQDNSTDRGYFEILSLNGTLSLNGSHLHICLADSTGETMGGHLAEGNVIYTTAELVIAASQKMVFERVPDRLTGFNELKVVG